MPVRVPVGPRPQLPVNRLNEFDMAIGLKRMGDNRVTAGEAQRFVDGWSTRSLTPDQANTLKSALVTARPTFDLGAVQIVDRFVNVKLPTLTQSLSGIPATSAKLAWTPPTTREDGTPLTDLKGYVIMMGQQPGNYTRSVTLNDPAATSFQVNNLSSGTWYFAMKTLDQAGNESRPTGEVSKTIP